MVCLRNICINTLHKGDNDDDDDDDDYDYDYDYDDYDDDDDDDDDYDDDDDDDNNNNEKFKEKFGSCTRKTIDTLYKTAILGTSHIIQKVLQCEP